MRILGATLAVGIALLSGCGTSDAPDSEGRSRDAQNAGKTPERTAVPWKDYSPVVKKRIDRLEQKQVCSALQDEFNVADANNDSTMSRTGHNNGDLMAYIDEAIQLAHCY